MGLEGVTVSTKETRVIIRTQNSVEEFFFFNQGQHAPVPLFLTLPTIWALTKVFIFTVIGLHLPPLPVSQKNLCLVKSHSPISNFSIKHLYLLIGRHSGERFVLRDYKRTIIM